MARWKHSGLFLGTSRSHRGDLSFTCVATLPKWLHGAVCGKAMPFFIWGRSQFRVFFNGMEQPLVDASTMIPIVDPSRDPFPTNGREAGRALFPERPLVHDSEAPLPLVEIAEDPLTLDGDAEETDVQQEEQDDLQEEEDDTEDEELEDGEEDEETKMKTWRQRRKDSLSSSRINWSLQRRCHLLRTRVYPRLNRVTRSRVTPTLGKVAVFHADPAMADRTIERLKALLAMMPRKTAIIDLRELSRTRQKEEYSPLARAHLRADFGGRYWDRSQYIKTTYRSLPEAERTMSNQWERVVTECRDARWSSLPRKICAGRLFDDLHGCDWSLCGKCPPSSDDCLTGTYPYAGGSAASCLTQKKKMPCIRGIFFFHALRYGEQ